MENSSQLISEIVNRIVRDHKPLKIVLFGSRARGNANPGSDYDLLVIKSVSPHERRNTRRAIYHSLYGLGIGKDVILATPEEAKEYGHLVGSILKPALEEGIVLYEQAA